MRCLFFPRAVWVCALAAAVSPATGRAAGGIPPLNRTASSESHPGKFEWADLFTGDLDSAEHFYTSLLGWTSSRSSKPAGYKAPDSGDRREYVVLSHDGRPVAGLVQRTADKTQRPARWIGYAAVADLDKVSEAVSEAGGHIVAPARKVPSRGKQAIAVDAEGAVVGLLQSSSGDLPDRAPEDSEWTWFELYSKSPRTSANFYRRVFDYDIKPDTRSTRPDHYLMTSSGRNRAGMAPLPSDAADVMPDWVGFIRVSHLDALVAQVTALGGEVIEAPQPAEMESRFALVADPTGGVFGLVEFTSSP